MVGNAILFSEMTPTEGDEDIFNRWYDTEHIPIRMHAPGFRSAQRYRADNSLNYLTVYELDGPQALTTPAYVAIKGQPSDLTRRMLGSVKGFTRYIGKSIGHAPADLAGVVNAPVLYAVFFEVPEDQTDRFDSWYEEDHIPLLMEDEGWQGVRRFAILDGEPHRYNRLAVHYLAGRDVLNSEARRRARDTPRRAELAREPWFKGHYVSFDRWGERHTSREPA